MQPTLSPPSPFSLLARLMVETPDETMQVKLSTLFNSRRDPMTKRHKNNLNLGTSRDEQGYLVQKDGP